MAMGTAGRKNEDGSGETVVVSCVEVNTAVFPVLSTVNSESAPLGSLVVTSDADPSWVNRKNENSRVSVRLELRSDAAGGHFIEGPFLPSGGATFFIAGAIDKVNGTVTATADSLIAAPAGVSGDGTLASFRFMANRRRTGRADIVTVRGGGSTEADRAVLLATGLVGCG